MDDIRATESRRRSAASAVEQQNKQVADAAARVARAKEAYLHSVLEAATLREKTRRKKDGYAALLIGGPLCLIALILCLINGVLGILFIGAAGVGAWLLYRKFGIGLRENYNNRKSFFFKYGAALGTEEQLDWEGELPVLSLSFGWSCPHCAAKNAASSNYCTTCGTKKP